MITCLVQVQVQELLNLEPRSSIRKGVEKSIYWLYTFYKFVNVNILAKKKSEFLAYTFPNEAC